MNEHSYPDINVSTIDAWKEIQHNPLAVLIDVRTKAEWDFVGYADLSSLGKNIIKISWLSYPDMQINKNFVSDLQKFVSAQNSLYFICKTGGRSYDAAMAMIEAGYLNSFNIAYGFEGDLNHLNQRGMENGWKANSLPWRQN